MNRRAGIAGAALLIAAITVGARLAGFGRVFAFSANVGAGCTGTAYAAANQIPTVLFEVAAGGALASAVVPVLAGLLAQGRRAEADRVAAALLCWSLIWLVPLAALLALLAGPVTAAMFGSQNCPGGAAMAARMLLVFAPQVALYGVAIVLAAICQAHRRFGWPALAPLLSSLMVIGVYLLYGRLAGAGRGAAGFLPSRSAELVLSIGTTLGVAAMALPLIWPVLRTGTRLRPTLRLPAEIVARTRALAIAGVIAVAAQQLSLLVTLVIAQRVGGDGVFPVVQYAQAVYLLPYAVLAVPLATAAFPQLSADAARGDVHGLASRTAATTRAVLIASCLGAGALIAVAPAVQALFERLDAVGGAPVSLLGSGVTALAPGLVGWGLVAHLSRVLYAQGRPRAAAVGTGAGWAVAAVLAAALTLLLRGAGWSGAAAAVVGTSIGGSVGMSVAGAWLLAVVARVGGPGTMAAVGRCAAAAAVAAAVAALVGRWGVDALLAQAGGGTWSPVLIGLVGGGAVALLFAAVLTAGAPHEVRALRQLAKRGDG